MLSILKARWQQGYRTMAYPKAPMPALPERFAGRPTVAPAVSSDCARAACEACPVSAVSQTGSRLSVDLGRCVFCRACETASQGAIRFGGDYRLAAAKREDLAIGDGEARLGSLVSAEIRRLFGRSLKLRQVSAGGCNACEADVNVLNTVGWDLGRFGIQFVASPRHADGLLVTGPVTLNMESALLKTYQAVPAPKIVIATGACAISGGLYADHPECRRGVGELVPVDLYIPGCPPHPSTILDGLLSLLGKI